MDLPRRPEPFEREFPSLPIVSPDPRRPESERYGAFFYVSIVGLIILCSLLGWFGWRVWSLRNVWLNVYVLHDDRRSEADRAASAFALSRDPAVNQRQLWDVALKRSLPPLARYVVAEGLTAEAVSNDPRAYGVSVARSEGWPDWLRLLLIRPLAYRAALDLPVPRAPLASLARSSDHATTLWANYALAEGSAGDSSAGKTLRQAATGDGADRRLARLLVRALDANRLDDRLSALDEATIWLRRNHPAAAPLWRGWTIDAGRLVPSR